MYATKIQTEPAREPITLQEAKDHLRLDTADHDAYVAALIKAARQKAEGYTGRALITQTWELRRDWFAAAMLLPYPPLQSVSSVKYLQASDGTEATVASTVYGVDTYSEPGRVYLGYSQTWPTPRVILHAVRVTFVAGYGAFGTDVPEPVRHGMLLMIGDMHENRETVVLGTPSVNELKMSTTVEALLGPYRIHTV